MKFQGHTGRKIVNLNSILSKITRPVAAIKSLRFASMKSLQNNFTAWNGNSFVNSSPPEQNGRHFADDIFRCIFMKKKFVF